MTEPSLAGGARAGARLAMVVVTLAVLPASSLILSLTLLLMPSLTLLGCRRNGARAKRAGAATVGTGQHRCTPSHSSIRRFRQSQRLPRRRGRMLIPGNGAGRRAHPRGAEAGGARARADQEEEKNDGLPRCGTPAQAELEHQVKGKLADSVRSASVRTGRSIRERNLLEAALASLGNCIDCTRMSEGREVDCQRTAARLTQAESDAAKKQPLPR